MRSEFENFAAASIAPHATDWDRNEAISLEIISHLAEKGYLGASIRPEFGGLGMDQITYGILTEEIARACSSIRTLLTVHTSLVSETIQRWGTDAQRRDFLTPLAKGERLAAFALSEPSVGSDANAVETRYEETDDGYLLNGHKKWTSFGQIADDILVFAKGTKGVSAFLIPTKTPGITIQPIRGLLGTRASQIAEILLSDCTIEKRRLIGKEGWGFLQIANTALDNGRYSVACGCLGIIRAALEHSLHYASERHQFGRPLRKHQLIQRRLTEMTLAASSVALLCRQAGEARNAGNASAILLTSLAKYSAASEAKNVTDHAVQIHGAQGCQDNLPIERLYRDARIMEIIEGSTEMHQALIADQAEAALQYLFPSRS